MTTTSSFISRFATLVLPAASLLLASFVLIADSCVVGDRGRIHIRGRIDAGHSVGSW
jgi:hypothetical protein